MYAIRSYYGFSEADRTFLESIAASVAGAIARPVLSETEGAGSRLNFLPEMGNESYNFV